MHTNQQNQYNWSIIKLAILVFVMSPMALLAQTPYQLATAKDNVIKVLGT